MKKVEIGTYDAVEWYFNSQPAPALCYLDFGSLRRLNYQIGKSLISPKQYREISALAQEVDRSANRVLKPLIEVIDNGNIKRYFHKDTLTKAKKKKEDWASTFRLIPPGVRQFKAYKKDAPSLILFVDLDEKCRPAVICALWIKGLDKNIELQNRIRTTINPKFDLQRELYPDYCWCTQRYCTDDWAVIGSLLILDRGKVKADRVRKIEFKDFLDKTIFKDGRRSSLLKYLTSRMRK